MQMLSLLCGPCRALSDLWCVFVSSPLKFAHQIWCVYSIYNSVTSVAEERRPSAGDFFFERAPFVWKTQFYFRPGYVCQIKFFYANMRVHIVAHNNLRCTVQLRTVRQSWRSVLLSCRQSLLLGLMYWRKGGSEGLCRFARGIRSQAG